jgi:phenylacetate-CoA ligase
VAGRVGLDVDGADAGRIISSFGAGELGLHLCYETRATIALRRAALGCPTLAEELFGECGPAPAILAYNTYRTLIEAVDRDRSGYGRLTISMLDDTLPIPLLRYQTGDTIRLLDRARVAAHLHGCGVALPANLPDALLVLRGRGKDRLPDGTHVADYKDALYRDRHVADRLTGAFRLTAAAQGPRVHVQLVRGAASDTAFEHRLKAALRIGAGDVDVVVSCYETFPHGMGLDYERKFAYYATSP